jgi:hypothetical protein
MPNLTNVTASFDGTTVRVQGNKSSSATVRAYLNPDLTAYPTKEALYNAYDQITTPKAQDNSTNTSFDLSLPVDSQSTPYTAKVVSSDGKAATPAVQAVSIGVGQTTVGQTTD